MPRSISSKNDYIQSHPDGPALYGNLPSGIKAVRGPARFGLIMQRKKRMRNLKVHSKLPKDESGAVLRLKDGFVNNGDIPSATGRFVSSLTPQIPGAVAVKKADDEAEQRDFETRMQNKENFHEKQINAFLRGQSSQASLVASQGRVPNRSTVGSGNVGVRRQLFESEAVSMLSPSAPDFVPSSSGLLSQTTIVTPF